VNEDPEIKQKVREESENFDLSKSASLSILFGEVNIILIGTEIEDIPESY
jgi:hypothetical protein